MRVLIVKLSSLGDVVHAMPVVHDIRSAFPSALIDWVVEPAFAPLVRRVDGVARVIECALRRWSGAWWTGRVHAEWRAFQAVLQAARYDAVLDLQGLTKSALIARLARLAPSGLRYGLANRTDGASHEPPARWLVDRAIRIPPRTHALDRSRRLVAEALGHPVDGPPRFGLCARPQRSSDRPILVPAHGSSRADKLWPEAAWIELGRRAVASGWRIALPQLDAAERERAGRISAGLAGCADLVRTSADTPSGATGPVEVWPALALDALIDRLAATQGVIGVDSGLSHIAVALDLPHVQLYRWPTAWRTGPLAAHGHRHQVAVEAQPMPTVDAVWAAWLQVREASE